MMHSIVKWYLYVSVSLLLACFALSLYWSFYPYDPLTINVQPFPVLNENRTVTRGDYLIYGSDTCRNIVAPVRVERVFKNSEAVFQAPVHTYLQDTVECRSHSNGSVRITSNVATGTYVLEITSFYRVNPIREIPVKVTTEPFIVIDNEL